MATGPSLPRPPAPEDISDHLETGGQSRPADSKLDELTRQEISLWRTSLVLLVLLAIGVALVSWDQIRSLPERLEALPIGLVVLVLLFGIYAWKKSRQIAELRGLIRGLEQRGGAPPDERQLKQLFEMIARSQQGYRDLIDTFDALLFSASLDGDILAANRSFVELFGLTFPEVIGRRLDDFVDLCEGSARAAAEKALPHFLERRYWAGVLCIRLKKSGAMRFFDCVFHAIVKDGQVRGFSGLARDITRERASELRFTELFETLQEGVYLTTPEGKLLDANPALVRMLGYSSKEELLGKGVEELYQDPAERAMELAELDRRGTIEGREITLRRKDGTPAICLDTSTAIHGPSGRTLRYQGTLVDITQRREMEKRLYRQQELARRLVDCFPDMVVVFDTQARYTYVSPRIKEVLGYEPEEMIGQKLGDRTDPEDRKVILQLFDDLVTGKINYGSAEYRTLNKQGEWRLFRASASPLFDAKGRVECVIASSRDVTEQKRLEQQLIQSERLAAMGQMIAGVAHELNNPLTAILGVTELLRDQAIDDTSRRQLDLAHRQARRAAHIVQNLLSFSRPPSPRKTFLHLSDLVQRTLQLHEHSLRTNNITVDFVPKPDLPSVLGDANQLMQVFLNLITNAEQAIREVRDHGTIRIRLADLRNRVMVVFQDDGAGIRRELLPKLFDPFFTTKRPGRGTGLGLSICMAILREHNGDIEAQPLPAGGSVFTVSLPVGEKKEVVVPSGQRGAREQPGVSRMSLDGRRVLVVDDEESIRELVQDGLSARGLRVDCAATAEEALQLAASRAYDVVLCDLNLEASGKQGLSGKQFYERLRAECSDQKPLFIFMTGDLVDPAMLEELSRSGNRVVQKPFRISELSALLSDALLGSASSKS